MISAVLAGGLVGAACALPTAHLAERTMLHRPAGFVRLRLVLTATTATFGAVATIHRGLTTAVLLVVTSTPAVAAAAVDAHERRLPDKLTAAFAAVVALEVAVLLCLDSAVGLRGALAFAMGGVGSVVAKVIVTEAIGWGDVKLVPSLAAFLAVHGWWTLYVGVLAWSCLIALASLLALLRPSPTGIVAFGPALVIGSAAALVAVR